MASTITNYKIEGKVIETMLITSALFLLLMAFRHKNTEPCRKVDFSFRTASRFDVAYEKERVYFSSEIKYDANSWEWDFGDKSPNDTKSGPYATHEYAKPGEYTVRLIINGKCSEAKSISIVKRSGNNKILVRPVWPPETLVAGREYAFGDSTLGASSWSWYFDKDETTYSKQDVIYQFLEPGEKTVVLVVNEDPENGIIEKKFKVLPAPKLTAPVIPGSPTAVGGSGGGGTKRVGDIPLNPGGDAGADNTNTGKSLEDMIRDASKVPNIGETTLKAYVLDINGDGAGKLKDYLKNRSYGNCNIIFNGRSLSLDQLKENMKEHAKYGKTLTVNKETDARENFIKVIDITAEMEAKDRLIGKSKPRKYPF